MENRLGDTIKLLRTKKNLSQQQLAQQLYVDRSSIANWESGRRVPDLLLLTRLAQIFNVDISVLTSAADLGSETPEVILVDDESILLAGMVPILSEAMPNATITGFIKPSEAMNYARKNRISIAFLDIEIGQQSGLELCKDLMKLNPLTNVIFLTSYPDYAAKAWETKASGFLVKPLQIEDVKEQLTKLRFPVLGLI